MRWALPSLNSRDLSHSAKRETVSKAFTKEDSEETSDTGDSEVPQPRSRHITPEGFRRLSDEATRLWRVERPRITEEVAAAAAQGDRSENAEYIYGKKKLREIDRRIRYLTKRLDTIIVVHPSPEQRGKVFFGAWVTVTDEDDKEATYRIVGSDEIDLGARKISADSPLAKALLGKEEGATVTVQRPKGPTEVTIEKVWYEGLAEDAEPKAPPPSKTTKAAHPAKPAKPRTSAKAKASAKTKRS